MENHLVVFVRAPALGRVKTRLAADVGAVRAWRFQRDAAAATLRRLAGDPRWRCWLAVTPDRAARRPVLCAAWPPVPDRLAQGRGDLGRRMFRPMWVLPPGPVVVVGTDIPGLRARHVARAFRLLGRHDAVFGPAADGGYWLVGLRRRPRRIDPFAGVRWSGPNALADTLANLRAASVGFVETLSDVDDGAALRRLSARRRSAARP